MFEDNGGSYHWRSVSGDGATVAQSKATADRRGRDEPVGVSGWGGRTEALGTGVPRCKPQESRRVIESGGLRGVCEGLARSDAQRGVGGRNPAVLVGHHVRVQLKRGSAPWQGDQRAGLQFRAD